MFSRFYLAEVLWQGKSGLLTLRAATTLVQLLDLLSDICGVS
jgi:hypothetical protein